MPSTCDSFQSSIECRAQCINCYGTAGACSISENHCTFDCNAAGTSWQCMPSAVEVPSSCIQLYPNSIDCQLACSKCPTIKSSGCVPFSQNLSCDPASQTAICSRVGPVTQNTPLKFSDLNPLALPLVTLAPVESSTTTTTKSLQTVSIETKSPQTSSGSPSGGILLLTLLAWAIFQ